MQELLSVRRYQHWGLGRWWAMWWLYNGRTLFFKVEMIAVMGIVFCCDGKQERLEWYLNWWGL